MPARGEVELAGIGFGVGDEFRNGRDRNRQIHLEHERHARGAADRHEVAEKIDTELVVERVVDRMRRNRLEQCVAVRRRFRGRFGADIAAGARPVLDDKGLPHPLRQPLRHQPGKDVGAAAGGEADDDAHRLRGIGLCESYARCDRERGSARDEMQKPAATEFHDGPPLYSCTMVANLAAQCVMPLSGTMRTSDWR